MTTVGKLEVIVISVSLCSIGFEARARCARVAFQLATGKFGEIVCSREKRARTE